jgi:hypothetical protein
MNTKDKEKQATKKKMNDNYHKLARKSQSKLNDKEIELKKKYPNINANIELDDLYCLNCDEKSYLYLSVPTYYASTFLKIKNDTLYTDKIMPIEKTELRIICDNCGHLSSLCDYENSSPEFIKEFNKYRQDNNLFLNFLGNQYRKQYDDDSLEPDILDFTKDNKLEEAYDKFIQYQKHSKVVENFENDIFKLV